ncbi:uncharacterized protein LY89DRAFT_699034 [Mollisia scopiformis]|uniref:Uncharacterized protein n=1 Tax=Mollisia scopiformis TaxID=149040 RepID=A0A194X2D0_MOLSC|nr:uncharacterized protein LY89DRAFT_699034 [Mollisia scopiformis]KUJ13992.1 hypothetical protein LY89DRAFT_699034 [Mollisia scopiformis]
MPRSWRVLVAALLTIVGFLSQHFRYDVKNEFPSYIWQTWKNGPGSSGFEEVKGSAGSWDRRNPGSIHRILSDAEAEELLKDLYNPFPEIIEAYNALPKPVLKADFFRYLILLAKGGIYTDIDTAALKPTSVWIPEEYQNETIGLVVGIEADPDREDWHQWYSRRVQFCQWTIQSKPGHPVLREIIATITHETLRLKAEGKLDDPDLSVIEFTGPALWTDVIFSHLNGPQCPDRRTLPPQVTWKEFTGITSPRMREDVLVLPITSFSPGVGHMGSRPTDDPMAFVRHEFSGSWKEEKK